MSTHRRIHWIGAGLSSGPGILRLVDKGYPVTLWNRTLSKAEKVIEGRNAPNVEIKQWDITDFGFELNPGDIAVSMLPAPMHPEIARVCIENEANLVTTSYLSDAMKALDEKAKSLDLTLLNEVGLDPGIDHLMAHLLVNEYKSSKEYSPDNVLSFRSYCGGFPKIPNDFKYKFSWSPAGVLRALTNPAKYVAGGEVKTAKHPWKDLSEFKLNGEIFQIYPNRDSTPYLKEYGFEPNWKIDFFCRGTIRLNGWSQAWKDIFNIVENSPEKIEPVAEELWNKHQYGPNDPDRVVLFVQLEAKREGQVVWSRTLFMDEQGSDTASAMGRLVSYPATLGVEMILNNRAPKGVAAAPDHPEEIHLWFDELKKLGSPIGELSPEAATITRESVV